MKESIAGLARRRSGSSAAEALTARQASKGDEQAAQHVALLHTTVHITEEHRTALHTEAMRRFTEQLARRIDASAVARDVLDFWTENQDAFTAWLEARKR